MVLNYATLAAIAN